MASSNSAVSNYNSYQSARSNSGYSRGRYDGNAAEDNGDWHEEPPRHQPSYTPRSDNRRYQNYGGNNWPKKSQGAASSYDMPNEKRPSHAGQNRGSYGFTRSSNSNNDAYQRNDRNAGGFANGTDARYNQYPQRNASPRYQYVDEEEDEEYYDEQQRRTPDHRGYQSKNSRHAEPDEQECDDWRARRPRADYDNQSARYNDGSERNWNSKPL